MPTLARRAGLTAATTVTLLVLTALPASASAPSEQLAPRTAFTMAPDGSSGLTQSGAGIPNIDSVKKTIAMYYGDTGDGTSNKTSSPYITEVTHDLATLRRELKPVLSDAKRRGQKPAIVLDVDDTTLWTYDMEVGAMHFVFNPTLQDQWVQQELFPAVPGMVDFANYARSLGYSVFGLTGRNDNQKTATLQNLKNVGYQGFTSDNTYTKWTSKPPSVQPGYITCVATCTTVEYKAGTRAHIESLGYTIEFNLGDQWSDLQGGYARRVIKLPNPTYYLPSADLPGVNEPWLTPRTHFFIKPDGSSGLTESGEGIPNVDSVKKTIAAYYGDTGTGLANKTASPYISEMGRLIRRVEPILLARCRVDSWFGVKPAVVFDVDDTTLWTYDMEVGAMHFVFDPTLQNEWVQDEKFPAVPGMVAMVNEVAAAGCAVVGLTGRNDDQKAATLDNLKKVGYTAFSANRFFTKWTGAGTSQQPSYIHCAASKCTTIEYKSQTRAYVESAAGGGYQILANFGDQFSDLIGGHARTTVKLPNPTYYLP